MTFNQAYQFLKGNISKKIITIKELDQIICSTKQFEPTIDGYLLTDCIIPGKELCSFNSYVNSAGTKVIAIDITFEKKEDFNNVKEMSWDSLGCNNMRVMVEKVYLYSI